MPGRPRAKKDVWSEAKEPGGQREEDKVESVPDDVGGRGVGRELGAGKDLPREGVSTVGTGCRESLRDLSHHTQPKDIKEKIKNKTSF